MLLQLIKHRLDRLISQALGPVDERILLVFSAPRKRRQNFLRHLLARGIGGQFVDVGLIESDLAFLAVA